MMLVLVVLFKLNGSAQTSISTADMLDGVLSGMSGEIDFDSMLDGMSGGINFDEMLSGMDEGINFDGIASSIAVDRTLDYLSNLYAAPLNTPVGGSYGSRGSYAPQFTGIATLPVYGAITSRYGYRPSFKRMHKGIDISLQVGDTVRSALDGTVTRADVDPRGYGLFIVISHHNGLETRYGHLSGFLVAPGSRVMAGDPIALGGNTGNSTGPHLHFETRQNGTAFDPTAMFDFSIPSGMPRHRDLAALDNLNPKFTKQSVENPGMVAVATADAPRSADQRRSTYVVKPGDTVVSVARDAGISVLTLCRLNMLSTTDPLQPGRMLKLR